jgi:hypothetical protein
VWTGGKNSGAGNGNQANPNQLNTAQDGEEFEKQNGRVEKNAAGSPEMNLPRKRASR